MVVGLNMSMAHSITAPKLGDRCKNIFGSALTTETLSPPHCAHVATDDRLGGNQLILQSLMVALLVIMRQIVMHCLTQRVFAEEDHLVQHFPFDRAHESLTMGVQIGRLRW